MMGMQAGMNPDFGAAMIEVRQPRESGYTLARMELHRAERAPGPAVDPHVLNKDTLGQWLQEIRNQPLWRPQADREADYYDGNQLDPDQLAMAEERGLAPLITNLIKPTIDVVLGMEAKTRTDAKVRPEAGETNTEVAEALSVKLHHAEVLSRLDRACSDAYAHQVKVGMGWIEVARNADPFKPPYRARAIHRREMFWDWRAQEPDLADARYLVRKQWVDKDVAIAAFPKSEGIIKPALGGWQDWDYFYTLNNGLTNGQNTAQQYAIDQYEWMNSARGRVAIYECWYRKLVRGLVLKLPNGRVVEYDEANRDHVVAVLAGQIAPEPATFMRVRVSFYMGPHLLGDFPSPYRHRNFPYVPFFGFREDRTGIPYGLIRAMMSPQDEINARKAKMMWLLSAKRVITDEDAVVDHQRTAEEVARPDAYIVLNSKRRANSQFSVDEPAALAPQQFQVLQEAKAEINQAAGVYQTMMGSDTQAKSGLAINSLVEQGTTTLAEINDNYRFSRRQAYELLLSLVQEDLEGTPNIPVTIEDDLNKKVVVLNQFEQDEMGNTVLLNDVGKVRVAAVLDDVPSTPTYRNQQLMQLMEMVKGLPGNIQALVIDFVMEASDLPQRKQMAERIRKAAGLETEGGEDPEKQQMAQMIQQLQAQLNGEQMAELRAKVAKLEADTALSRAKAYEVIENVADREMAEAQPREQERAEEQEMEAKVFGQSPAVNVAADVNAGLPGQSGESTRGPDVNGRVMM